MLTTPLERAASRPRVAPSDYPRRVAATRLPRTVHIAAAASPRLVFHGVSASRREASARTLRDGRRYQSWATCNLTQTLTTARQGVNVVIWFATSLSSVNGTATVTGGPDYACVAEVADAIAAADLPTTHLISIGGWDAPHPDTNWTGSEWFDAWERWNDALPRPFDGFDWDLEGNDNLNASTNVFTQSCLDLVVAMSDAAAAAGYVVSMVPAQSYLDVTTDACVRRAELPPNNRGAAAEGKSIFRGDESRRRAAAAK